MVMELDKILDEMESILSDGWRIPLVNKVVIDENEITMVMDKLRAAVPLEVKRAHPMTCWKNRRTSSINPGQKQTIS